jgi:hypothetical protein
MDGQGIVNFGNSVDGDDDDVWVRALIAGGTFRATLPWNLLITGTDIEIRDNTFGPSALYDMFFGATNFAPIVITPPPSTVPNQRYRGGRNTFLPLCNIDPRGPAVSWSSGTVNGDTVSAPIPPNMAPVPAWVGPITRPSNSVPAVVPLNIIRPEILWWGGPYDGNNVVPTTGTYFSARRGIWRAGLRTGALEYRWLRNGTPIAGATNPLYRVQAADLGTSIVLEVRHQNATGWSLWAPSTAVVPV